MLKAYTSPGKMYEKDIYGRGLLLIFSVHMILLSTVQSYELASEVNLPAVTIVSERPLPKKVRGCGFSLMLFYVVYLWPLSFPLDLSTPLHPPRPARTLICHRQGCVARLSRSNRLPDLRNRVIYHRHSHIPHSAAGSRGASFKNTRL